MGLRDLDLEAGYTMIDRDPDSGRVFASDMLRNGNYGAPLGLVIHRQGNPIPDKGAERFNPSGGATALNSLRWGIREKAFSIHYYIDGDRVYRAVPEGFGAYHVLEFRVAQERGRPIYPSTFRAIIPKTLTAAPKGQYAGNSKPRGDVGMIGIECVDRVDSAGRIYFDQATRRTAVLLARDILVRNARLRGTWLADTMSFSITGHQTWDQWTRPDDPGQALYLPAFSADVLDLAMGIEPWRVVGPKHDGKPPQGAPSGNSGSISAGEIAALAEHVDRARTKIARGVASLRAATQAAEDTMNEAATGDLSNAARILGR